MNTSTTKGRVGISRVAAILIIIVLAIAAGAVVYAMRTSIPGSTSSPTTSTIIVEPLAPALSVFQFSSQAIYANGTSYVMLTIANGGSNATNVIITLTSDAFPNTRSSSQNVGSGFKVNFFVPVVTNDMKDNVYPVTVTATYDTTGSSQTQLIGSGSVTLGPMVKIINVGWLWPAFSIYAKSTIGRNDSTDSHVTIQSFSKLAQYSQINVTETFVGDHMGLSITPASQSAGTIGPQSTSQQLSFHIASSSAPTGQYPISITAWAFGVEVARTTVVLTVS